MQAEHFFEYVSEFSRALIDILISILCTEYLRKMYRPTESSMKPLCPERDVLPAPVNRTVLGLVLTYNISVNEAGSKVFFKWPQFQDVLYESAFEGFLTHGMEEWLLIALATGHFA